MKSNCRLKNAAQLGAVRIIIRCLNAGLSLETLIDICCFNKNGSKLFDVYDFVKARSESWVFVESQIRENVQGIGMV